MASRIRKTQIEIKMLVNQTTEQLQKNKASLQKETPWRRVLLKAKVQPPLL